MQMRVISNDTNKPIYGETKLLEGQATNIYISS